jgi:hypothetical protein
MEYDCAKCSGSGRLLHYGHVMNGLCFACSGHGKVSKKPAQPSVKWKCFYDYKQLNTRVSLEVGEALEVLHRKTRLTKAAAVELALRDFIAKYDIIVSQPKVD